MLAILPIPPPIPQARVLCSLIPTASAEFSGAKTPKTVAKTALVILKTFFMPFFLTRPNWKINPFCVISCYNLSMNIVAPVGIVILATLILAFLQLEPGVFALFLHYGSGKFSHRKRSLLTTFFMLGVETVSAGLFICALLFVNFLFTYTFRPGVAFPTWVFVAIFLILAIVSLLCYYRPGRNAGSALFIPRQCAAALENYAAKANTRSDAFILGVLSGVLELPFSLPLHLVSALAILKLSVQWPPVLILAFLFVLVPLIPLFLIRYKFRVGFNLADVIRARIRDKHLVRLVLCLSYAAIALLLVTMPFI